MNTSEELWRERSLLLQTVPLKKSINAVIDPCSLIYRFVLLSVAFNLNIFVFNV